MHIGVSSRTKGNLVPSLIGTTLALRPIEVFMILHWLRDVLTYTVTNNGGLNHSLFLVVAGLEAQMNVIVMVSHLP